MIPSNVLHRDISQQTFKYYCCIEETEIQFWSTSIKQTGYLQIQNNGATLSSLHSNVRNLWENKVWSVLKCLITVAYSSQLPFLKENQNQHRNSPHEVQVCEHWILHNLVVHIIWKLKLEFLNILERDMDRMESLWYTNKTIFVSFPSWELNSE